MFEVMEDVLLASASPRRRRYFEELGIAFDVASLEIDETPRVKELPGEYVARIAGTKSEAALEMFPDSCVVTADTIVYLGERIFGKPRSDEEAVRTLLQLSGREHSVTTAFVVACRPKNILHEESVTTQVRFTEFGEKVARAYVQTGESADKAGAYGIQGRGAVFVEQIIGSYQNVVGFPLCQVVAVLSKYGIVKTK